MKVPGRLPTPGGMLASLGQSSGKRLRRLLIAVPLLAVLLILQGIHQLALWLDLVLFPGYRRVQIRRPLFIIGPPRTGTTLLHRLVALNDSQFTSLPLWELLFAPAVCEKYLFLGLYRMDACLGGPLRRLLQRLEHLVFRGSDGVHTTSLLLPEEDFLLLCPWRACFLLVLAFPYCEEIWSLGWFDVSIDAAARARVLSRYHALLQRHAYVRGGDKLLLSKNASFSSWPRSLIERFPDARLIGLERSPQETVPSQLSAVSDGMRFFGNDVRDPELVLRFVDLMAFYYRHVHETLGELPEGQARLLRYTDLCDAPTAVVRAVLQQFGYTSTESFLMRLQSATKAAASYRSSHRYSLADFGLTEKDIRRHFDRSLTETATPSPGPGCETDLHPLNPITRHHDHATPTPK